MTKKHPVVTGSKPLPCAAIERLGGARIFDDSGFSAARGKIKIALHKGMSRDGGKMPIARRVAR